jgi:cystathionine beta-synthase
MIDIQGYPVVITLPEKMSLEKELTLRSLGAEIVRTPTSAPSKSEFSNIGVSASSSPYDTSKSDDRYVGVAKRLAKEIPNGVILDQYGNPNNPLAHELTTGPEIIAALQASINHPERPTSGKVDVLAAGAGTGGTLTGTSKAIKEKNNADALVLAIDPVSNI